MKYKFIWPGFGLIFKYWVAWMTFPGDQYKEVEELLDDEGLIWYDGWNATFWWVINHGWYRMNDKLTSTRDVGSYEEPNDFLYKC